MNNATTASAIFKAVYLRNPDFSSSFEDRLITQKLVYLLNELGVSCGENSFRWYKHGPYSQNLQNCMVFETVHKNMNVEFSDAGLDAIETITHMIETPHEGYSESQWIEALGSLLFMKQYLFPSLSDQELMTKFLEMKPHLSNIALNCKAETVLRNYKLLSCSCTN